MSDVDFKSVLQQAGIPTTEAELKSQWLSDVQAQGSQINNDSLFSPFWRVVSALITTPVLWLLDFMSGTALPAFFLQTSTGVYLELLADGFNLTRKPAVKATGIVQVTRADVGIDVTVPADTIIQTAAINGVVYQLRVTESTAFPPGQAQIDVPVEAVLAGSAHNLAAGYYAVLPVPIANVSAVTNGENWLIQPGADIESDEALRARIRNQFGTVSDYHTDSVYKSIISTFPGVSVDAIWFVHDAPRGPGTANAYVLFDFAAPVAQYLTDINLYITDQGHHGHGDDLLVLQMPEQPLTLDAVVIWHDPFLTAEQSTQLQSDCETFIGSAFRENTLYSPTLTYPFDRFSFSRLAQELHNEFSTVHSVAFAQADILSDLWVPRLTSLTITMQAAE